MKKVTYDARTIAVIGLLIALDLILTHLFAIQTPIVRISFGFLPSAMIGMLFGPWTAGIAGALADLAGIFLFGGSGAYFPGFTLSAFLGSFFYGFYLYKKPKTWGRVILTVLVITLVVNLGLNTLWLVIMYDQAARVIVPTRLLQNLIVAPIRVLMIHYIANHPRLRSVVKLDDGETIKR